MTTCLLRSQASEVRHIANHQIRRRRTWRAIELHSNAAYLAELNGDRSAMEDHLRTVALLIVEIYSQR